MRNLFSENQKAILTLPPRNDNEAEITARWNFPEGILKFDGQEFVFPEGFNAQASAKWLEESLLSVYISVDAPVEAECARCLTPVSLEISGELGYLYYSHGAEVSDEQDGFFDEFGDYMPVEIKFFGRTVDVMPQIQESIYTLLPTKVLCKDDCKGLCPVCGKNLNEGSCSCINENTDPRLEALRNYTAE